MTAVLQSSSKVVRPAIRTTAKPAHGAASDEVIRGAEQRGIFTAFGAVGEAYAGQVAVRAGISEYEAHAWLEALREIGCAEFEAQRATYRLWCKLAR